MDCFKTHVSLQVLTSSMATGHLGINGILVQRALYSKDNNVLASCVWVAIFKNLRQRLEHEISDRGFISCQALQDVFSNDHIATILNCVPRRDYESIFDHVSHHSLKTLALHILDSNPQTTKRFLQHPFDLSDETLFSQFATAGGTLHQWQRPVTAEDACIGWIFKHHWWIPPALKQSVVVEYPRDFIAPFYDRNKIGKGSYGTVWSLRVGGGNIIDYDDVR